MVAKGCEKFAAQWAQNWTDSNSSSSSTDAAIVLAATCCELCGVGTSYETAHRFFKLFYDGAVVWPAGESHTSAALELLVLSSLYNVPYLVCAAEKELKRGMSVAHCCHILTVADHHHAQQLRKYCLHFIASGYNMISKDRCFEELSPELVEEVEQTRQALQQLED